MSYGVNSLLAVFIGKLYRGELQGKQQEGGTIIWFCEALASNGKRNLPSCRRILWNMSCSSCFFAESIIYHLSSEKRVAWQRTIVAPPPLATHKKALRRWSPARPADHEVKWWAAERWTGRVRMTQEVLEEWPAWEPSNGILQAPPLTIQPAVCKRLHVAHIPHQCADASPCFWGQR